MLPSRISPFTPQTWQHLAGTVVTGWVLAQSFSKLRSTGQKIMQGQHETRQRPSDSEDWQLLCARQSESTRNYGRVQEHQGVSSTRGGSFCLLHRRPINVCGLNDWNENDKIRGRQIWFLTLST